MKTKQEWIKTNLTLSGLPHIRTNLQSDIKPTSGRSIWQENVSVPSYGKPLYSTLYVWPSEEHSQAGSEHKECFVDDQHPFDWRCSFVYNKPFTKMWAVKLIGVMLDEQSSTNFSLVFTYFGAIKFTNAGVCSAEKVKHFHLIRTFHIHICNTPKGVFFYHHGLIEIGHKGYHRHI